MKFVVCSVVVPVMGLKALHGNLFHTPRCIKVLNNIKLESADEQAGVEIIKKALRAPSSTIIKNSGIDPTLIVEKILQAQNPSEGYDALRNQHVDMLKAGKYCHTHISLVELYWMHPLYFRFLFCLGIIDPTKVVRSALQDAAGVATLLATAEVVITEIPKKEEPMGGGMGGGGMGGMGGMGM